MNTASNTQPWLLYGANGYEGRLIIEQALKRGHTPVLAGRCDAKVKEVARRYHLPWVAVDLEAGEDLRALLSQYSLLYNAAGPFVKTAEPLVQACIDSGTHYVDISGELPTVQMMFTLSKQAKEAGVCLLPSVGVSCVPTDCLARYVSERLPDATELEIAIDTIHSRSPGALTSILEMSAVGGRSRQAGSVRQERMGQTIKTIPFSHGVKTALSLPLADIETAYRHTLIPTIKSYVAQPKWLAKAIQFAAPVNKELWSKKDLRALVQKQLHRFVRGPKPRYRKKQRTYVYACATNHIGKTMEAWLETIDGYDLTAALAPMIVEKVLDKGLTGAYTPAEAFGRDFILEVPDTYRMDTLDIEQSAA